MKKIIIILIIVTIIAAGIFYFLKISEKGPEYSTFTVARGTLSQSVEATGKVESAEKIELNFKTAGQIANILVRVGDEIKAGQKLASLDARALESQVDEAEARLNQTLADYEKLLTGASAEDIKVAEDTVAQKLQDLTTAKNNLVNLKSKSKTELTNLKEAGITASNNEIIVAEGAIDEINNTLNDSDAQSTLSIKNASALIQAEENQEIASIAIDQSEQNINLINLNSANQEILNALDDLTQTLSKVTTALADVINVLVATLTSSDLSETELDTLKSNIKSQQTKINTAKSNIQTAKSNWTNKIAYYHDQVNSYENEIKKAEKALEVVNSQLSLKKSPPRQFEIDAGKAKIAQVQAALNLARANLEETIITAPLDGIITQKNYQVGEQTSLTRPVLEMIGHSLLQIEIDIPESDIAKVKLGQEVEITLDAFGDEEKFTGKVIFIDLAETVIQDVVYYQVKVQFNEKEETPWQAQNLRPGMTANVTIYTNKKENVLFVPSRAVKSRDNEKYVEVLEPARRSLGEGGNGLIKEKTVTTGLRGNEGVEITSGLGEGEQVVTFVKE